MRSFYVISQKVRVAQDFETVGSMDATVKPTGMYLRHVSKSCATRTF